MQFILITHGDSFRLREFDKTSFKVSLKVYIKKIDVVSV